MKNVLKISLTVLLFLFSYTLSFSQGGTCGQIVPFASEPRVDDCCVTFEMDLSIGVNWILYPGNGLPQTESITSFDSSTNIVTYCYDPVIQGTVYPNITYLDEFGKSICSSWYPIILDCTGCGLASDIVVDGCCIFFDVYSEFRTVVTYINPNGNSGSIIQADPVNSPYSFKQCETEPGTYTLTIECFDEDDVSVGFETHTYTIGTDCDGTRPRNQNAAIEELSKGALTVFPNPATDRLTINAPNQVIENVMLFDMSNRLLLNQRVSKDDIHMLDLNDIQASGVYYLHIITDERSYNEKIVVQR
ncbi:MAG: T9SS type A sorting domain-containing protein [Bacteroidota bacterium]